jgi:hypothetical protein
MSGRVLTLACMYVVHAYCLAHWTTSVLLLLLLPLQYTEKMPPVKRAKRGTAMMTALPVHQQRHIAGKPGAACVDSWL